MIASINITQFFVHFKIINLLVFLSDFNNVSNLIGKNLILLTYNKYKTNIKKIICFNITLVKTKSITLKIIEKYVVRNAYSIFSMSAT